MVVAGNVGGANSAALDQAPLFEKFQNWSGNDSTGISYSVAPNTEVTRHAPSDFQLSRRFANTPVAALST